MQGSNNSTVATALPIYRLSPYAKLLSLFGLFFEICVPILKALKLSPFQILSNLFGKHYNLFKFYS